MASTAILKERTLNEHILSLNSHMEELAAAGEWTQISDLLGKRNAMLSQLDDSERRSALLAAGRATEKIQRMAEAARYKIADKLSTLQRGKQATSTYQANT